MMLVHHFTEWLSGDARSVIPGFPGLALTDIAAPAFALTAGASLALFSERAAAKGVAGPVLRGQVLRRYGGLVPIGMLLTFAALSNVFYFSVLDALGWGTLTAYAVMKLIPSSGLRWASAAVMFIASRPVAGFVEETVPLDYVVNAFTGKFPVLEYAGFAVVGALIVPHLKQWTRRDAFVAAAGSLAVAAVATLVVGAPDRYPGGLAFVIPGLAGTAA